jgi:hypothetical protein
MYTLLLGLKKIGKFSSFDTLCFYHPKDREIDKKFVTALSPAVLQKETISWLKNKLSSFFGRWFLNTAFKTGKGHVCIPLLTDISMTFMKDLKTQENRPIKSEDIHAVIDLVDQEAIHCKENNKEFPIKFLQELPAK